MNGRAGTAGRGVATETTSLWSSHSSPIPGDSGDALIDDTSEAARPHSGATPNARRYHALDSLRAAMMFLGIVLHAGLSYSHMPRSATWPFKDARATVVADVVMTASGLFRMPVFFLLAGFFAASLHRKRGRAGLAPTDSSGSPCRSCACGS